MPFEDDFLEDLEAQIEADTGFHVLDHELKFYGQCKECAEAPCGKRIHKKLMEVYIFEKRKS